MTNPLLKKLAPFFGIKGSEARKTVFLQWTLFLLITTLLILKPTINSLFLTELSSDALPTGYLLTALVAVGGYFFYRKALDNYSLRRIIYFTFLVSIIMMIFYGVGFYFNIHHNYTFLYALFVFVALFGLLTTSQFWLLTSMIYDVREAKKVYGFIGAGGIAGGIFGGYLTSILTEYIETQSLLFVAAFFVFLSMLIIDNLYRTEIKKRRKSQKSEKQEVRKKTSFQLVRENRLLSLITLATGVAVLVSKLVDYQYNDYASRLIGNSQDLAGFFGFWLSNMSIISLVIQLFLTKKILDVFGVSNTMALMPTGILFGSILLLIIPELWVLIGIKMVEGSLKQSVDKSAKELVFIPIPTDVKKKTKNFIDVVVDSLATGVAGVLLIVIVNYFHVTSTSVSFAIIFFGILWLITIYYLKKSYVQHFRNLVAINKVRQEDEQIEFLEFDVLEMSKRVDWILQRGDEEKVALLLNRTKNIDSERFFYSIKPLLKHKSARIRKLAIQNLYYLKTENLSAEIETMISDENQKVVIEAFRYLVERYEGNHEELFNKYLESKSQKVVNGALIGLSLEIGTDEEWKRKFGLDNRVKRVIYKWFQTVDVNEKKDSLNTVIEVVGNSKLHEFYYIIHEELNNEETVNYKNVLLSAAKTNEDQFINGIIKFLRRKESRNTAKIALFQYGESIIRKLIEKVLSGSVPFDEAKYIPSVIEMFNSKKAAKGLMFLVKNAENPIDLEAIESLKRLKWEGKNKFIQTSFIHEMVETDCNRNRNSYSIIQTQERIIENWRGDTALASVLKARMALVDLLRKRMHWHDDRLAGVISLKFPVDDIELMKEVLTNPKESPEERMNAIEYLDNKLDVRLRMAIIPLLDLESEIFKKGLKEVKLPEYSDYQSFEFLLKRPDVKIKHATLFLMSQLNDKQFIPLLNEVIKDQNLLIRKQASDIFSDLNRI